VFTALGECTKAGPRSCFSGSTRGCQRRRFHIANPPTRPCGGSPLSEAEPKACLLIGSRTVAFGKKRESLTFGGGRLMALSGLVLAFGLHTS
jgi:hypothetical protein